MKMLLATAALLTLLTSDAFAQSRWRGAYRSYGLWWAPGQAYALAPFYGRRLFHRSRPSMTSRASTLAGTQIRAFALSCGAIQNPEGYDRLACDEGD